MLIQESWLFSFEIEIENKVLNNSMCFDVLYDKDIERQGRPYGG